MQNKLQYAKKKCENCKSYKKKHIRCDKWKCNTCWASPRRWKGGETPSTFCPKAQSAMSDMLLDKLDKGLDEIIRQKKKTASKKRKSTGAKKPAGGRTPKAKTGVGRRRRHPDSCVAADLRRALSRIESTDRRVNERAHPSGGTVACAA